MHVQRFLHLDVDLRKAFPADAEATVTPLAGLQEQLVAQYVAETDAAPRLRAAAG